MFRNNYAAEEKVCREKIRELLQIASIGCMDDLDIMRKWTGRRQDWSLIHAQMAIYIVVRTSE